MSVLDRRFAALADPTRRQILDRVAAGPVSVSVLAEPLHMTLPGVLKHVRVLEEAAMVSRRKLGRTNFLALEREPLSRLQAWTGQFHPWWGTDAETLDNYAGALGRDPPSSEEAS